MLILIGGTALHKAFHSGLSSIKEIGEQYLTRALYEDDVKGNTKISRRFAISFLLEIIEPSRMKNTVCGFTWSR